ncbi:IS200/IS605 family element RNA-guided endonuclease TnpB [Bacillus mexicanus]|uniref:IS200/IS605 family element RNA-guided endonuclease TnpB n=1 Tax=Bacillus mexicanus TaxID=2834415 RepID=UPI003D223161
MLRHLAYKFRIYPTKEQQILIHKTFGSCRFLFNHFLHEWNQTYEKTGKGLSYNACAKELPKLKNTYIWLKEIDSTALQSSVRFLSDSFTRFFKKQNRAPRFKRKGDDVQSYKTVIQGKAQNAHLTIQDNKIKLPKLGWVKFANSRNVNGRILSVTVRKNAAGKFFISVVCEEMISAKPKTNNTVGIDLGITDFAILSTGKKVNNHRFTKRMEKKLKREQRKLSRRALLAKKNNIKLIDAKNYQKQKIKVARLHEKVKNQRQDFLHKLSTDLVKNHDVIVIEDLHTEGMLKNRKLSKSISDVSWSEFVSMITYKADWYGKTIIKIDRWFPSSQICNYCGHQDGPKPLHIRTWTCNNCGCAHDRDINAAMNIKNEGLRLIAGGINGVA